MRILNNQKGVVLVTAYLVILILMALTGAFFARTVQNRNLVQRQYDEIQALYHAEKGAAYAFFECADHGWSWFTHRWDHPLKRLLSNNLTNNDAMRTQGANVDCSFDIDGRYTARDGSFMVKTFADPNISGMTVVWAMGRSGGIERVIERRIGRRSIYDYFMWSPNDLHLSGTYECAGGGLHTNANIILHNGVLLNEVGELSTGEDSTIRYTSSPYERPSWHDNVDGTTDSLAPLPSLASSHIWKDIDDPPLDLKRYPYARGWPTESNWPSPTNPDNWPPLSWRSVDEHFAGDPTPGSELNARLELVKKDAYGNVVFSGGVPVLLLGNDVYEEIPGHLDQTWKWDKYDYGWSPEWTHQLGADSEKVTYIDGEGNPATAAYWNQLALDYPGLIDPEILDGIYGDDVDEGTDNVDVKNTNTILQDAAWDTYVANSNLPGYVMTNDDGFELDEPKFAGTYKTMAQRNGSYYSLDSTNADCQDWAEDHSNETARDDCLKASILKVEETLDASGRNVAEYVEFVDTRTGKWNRMLEIDIDKMGKAGLSPTNGIIYSEIPLRLTNAQTLPGTGSPADDTFNVICEENIYLKGNFNNPPPDVQWMPSAIISKKSIYTLSADFNDPQVLPALTHVRDWPFIYVADVAGDGIYKEVDPKTYTGTVITVQDGYLSKGYYPKITDPDNRTEIQQKFNAKEALYQTKFNYDASYKTTATATFSWTRDGDGSEETYTWGMMPNKVVSKDTTYNCLMAAFRINPQGPGEVLERWGLFQPWGSKRKMNGSYFQLVRAEDGGDFAAPAGDYVTHDFSVGWSRVIPVCDTRGAQPSWDWLTYTGDWGGRPETQIKYDSKFISASSAAKPIFFGGGPPASWRELDPSVF